MNEHETLENGAVGASSNLLNEIMAQTKIRPDDEYYKVAQKGVQAFLTEILQPKHAEEKVDKKQIDAMIEEIDRRMGLQVDEILHDLSFQEMESTWRGLKLLIERTDFRENIKIEMLNASKSDLAEDFEDAPDITSSGLYQNVYTANYGQFGGEPIGLMVADYEIGPGAADLKLLQSCATVAAMAHAPFVAAAAPSFFTLKEYDELPKLKDLQSVFDGPQFIKWRGFRATEDSRYVGLAMPQMLLRNPYNSDNPIKEFSYNESTKGQGRNYCWGRASIGLANRMIESFAKYRWSPNIIGPQSGGSMDALPTDLFVEDGKDTIIGPTEVTISDRREYELSEQGFIPLTMRKNADNATFFSANSVQKPKLFGNTDEGKQAELNYRLGTQLPYMMVICRIAHYIKVLQRENLGSWKGRMELEGELNKWIRQYIADQNNPTTDVRSRRPLRSADIKVLEVPGEAGWYQVKIEVTPHFKYMGANFTLSLTGKLETA